MTNRSGKVWGSTSELYRAPNLQIHLLDIQKGGFCSEHRHSHKTNQFIVLIGRLEILTWPPGSAKPDRTVLASDEQTRIPTGVWHQFRAVERTLALELYEPEPVDLDIERRTEGGLDEDAEWAGLP